jgi:murein DD-endopeptidase
VTYSRPVDPVNGRMSTYWAHNHREPPSSEAGVDYYCPIGTPIRAAGPGRIVEIGGGTLPATGRFVTIDLDDGRRVRYLHLSRWVSGMGINARVSKGQTVGYSGASGYGSEFFGADSVGKIPANTGGPHVHATLWPTHAYRFGRYPLTPTLDLELYIDKPAPTGGGATYTPLGEESEDDVFIAVVKGNWHLVVPQGSGKPRAIILDGGSLQAKPDVPVFHFTDANTIMGLQTAVEGIFA